MAGDDLTRDRLRASESVVTLGAVAAKKLLEEGSVVLHLSQEGVVQVCPLFEVQLDGLEEDEALRRLIDRGYNDQQLTEYLEGRTARGGLRYGEDLRPVTV